MTTLLDPERKPTILAVDDTKDNLIQIHRLGPAVNLASRLQQAADAGDVLMSYETHALVRDTVIAEERPPIKVDGIARSIATYVMVKPSRAPGGTEGPAHADSSAGGRV